MTARLLFALALVMTLPAAIHAQATWVPGRIIESTSVWIEPNPARVPLRNLAPGTAVTVIAVEGDWLNVAFEDERYGRRVGYVPRKVVDFEMRPPPAARQPSSPDARPEPPTTRGHSVAAVTPVADPSDEPSPPPDSPAPPSDVRPESAAPPAAPDGPSLPAERLSSPAGRAPVSPTKGMPVTVMIPRGLLKDDGPVSGRRLPVVAADIDNPTGRQISVNGRSDWMQAGLPSLLEVSVERIRHLKGHTELELRGTDVVVKLRFADSVVEPEATLGQLVAAGGRETEAAQRYRDEAHAALATLLPGDLRELEDSRKRSILAALQSAPGSPDVHVHEGQLYASYDLGVDGLVYNDRDFDRPTIVAYVLNETVLTRLRDISRSLPDVPELRGIRVVHRIPHKSAKNAPADEYRLEIVATTEQGVKFSEGAISDQALLDASVLLIDGSPLQIRLAASSD